MIFTAIMSLIGILCIILFVMYIIQNIQTKKRIQKIKEETKKEIKVEEKKKEPLYTKETTEIEDIASAIFKRYYPICVIMRCADTGRVPPARGVMVSAAAFPAGLRTVRTELTTAVVTIAIPTI